MRWRESLTRLGNVSHKGVVPPAAITRVAVFDVGQLLRHWPPALFALGLCPEAEISPESFSRYGHLHRSVLAAVL